MHNFAQFGPRNVSFLSRSSIFSPNHTIRKAQPIHQEPERHFSRDFRSSSSPGSLVQFRLPLSRCVSAHTDLTLPERNNRPGATVHSASTHGTPLHPDSNSTREDTPPQVREAAAGLYPDGGSEWKRECMEQITRGLARCLLRRALSMPPGHRQPFTGHGFGVKR